MPLLTLYEWGQRLPVPRSMETLRRWVRAHKIHPHPDFDGYQYLVEEQAVKIGSGMVSQRKTGHSADSLTARIKSGSTKKKP